MFFRLREVISALPLLLWGAHQEYWLQLWCPYQEQDMESVREGPEEGKQEWSEGWNTSYEEKLRELRLS